MLTQEYGAALTPAQANGAQRTLTQEYGAALTSARANGAPRTLTQANGAPLAPAQANGAKQTVATGYGAQQILGPRPPIRLISSYSSQDGQGNAEYRYEQSNGQKVSHNPQVSVCYAFILHKFP